MTSKIWSPGSHARWAIHWKRRGDGYAAKISGQLSRIWWPSESGQGSSNGGVDRDQELLHIVCASVELPRLPRFRVLLSIHSIRHFQGLCSICGRGVYLFRKAKNPGASFLQLFRRQNKRLVGIKALSSRKWQISAGRSNPWRQTLGRRTKPGVEVIQQG